MNVSEKMVENVPNRHLAGYAMGMYAVGGSFAIVSLYLTYFYTDVFLLSPAIMTVLFLVCRIFDGINDPIIGLLADRTDSRWGKFRPYLLFGPIFVIIFGTLTFTVPDMGATGKIIWAFVTYIVFQTIKIFVTIPYLSMIPLITIDARERTKISSIQQIITPISFLVASIFVLKLVGLFPSESKGFSYSALIFCIITALFMWIAFFSTRKYDFPGNPLFKSKENQEKISIRDNFKVITQNPPFIILFFIFLTINLTMAVS